MDINLLDEFEAGRLAEELLGRIALSSRAQIPDGASPSRWSVLLGLWLDDERSPRPMVDAKPE